MPLYDYRCMACEHEFELLQSINDPTPETCPKCGPAEIKKKVVAPSFTFKGGGWYKDLYGSAGGNKSGNSESKTETKSESKKEAKPAKSETKAKPAASDS